MIAEHIADVQKEREEINAVLCQEIADAWRRYATRDQLLIKRLNDLEKELREAVTA